MAIFSELKVLELASVLAGPSVGQFFAELGAEVIKIENLKTGGDVTRSWRIEGEPTDDRSAYFCSCNWGKKSVAIDLTREEGRHVVRLLAQQSDIVIVSYKKGDDEKLGVSYEQLHKLNPRLIYGQITGYGSDDERVGYDAVIQAESGFMDLNGEKGGVPTKMPVALIDILAAHHLKQSLLLALLNRTHTGKGSHVEVSLIQAAVTSLANQATNWLVGKKLPSRQGSLHPNIAPYGESFLTADGKRILLAIGSDHQFSELCSLLGVPALAKADIFLTNPARVKNRLMLSEHLKDKIAGLNSSDLLRDIHHRKIPAGLIQNIRETFEMPESKELLTQHGILTGVRTFAGQLDFGDDPVNLLPPPHFGEHTDDILSRLIPRPS